MCGRYSLTTAPEAMRQLFEFDNRPNLAARYNIAPTQDAPVIRIADGGRALAMLRWGIIPSWAKDRSMAGKMINARAGTVAEKPAFREALRTRRCLVPADGFYEWRTEDGGKQLFRIGMKGGGALETFTILTTTANPKLAPIHPRMPVIVPADHHAAWLDPDADPAVIPLGPYPVDPMAFYRVGTRVNAVRNADPACIAPLAAAPAAPRTAPVIDLSQAGPNFAAITPCAQLATTYSATP